MGIRSRKQDVKSVHEHVWENSRDNSEMRCLCGKIQVSLNEYERRKNVWTGYYYKVSLSTSYKRFCEQRKALLGGDLVKVKKLALEAKHELENRKELIEKPHFPDPSITNIYVVKSLEEEIFNIGGVSNE